MAECPFKAHEFAVSEMSSDSAPILRIRATRSCTPVHVAPRGSEDKRRPRARPLQWPVQVEVLSDEAKKFRLRGGF